MKKLRCVIVDDEPIAVGIIERFVAMHPDTELVASFTRSVKAFEYLESNQTDLVFLDIHMPGLTGLDLLSKLKNKPLCIFTTAYREYALEAFELDGIDYLKKPIRYERFSKAVHKALKYTDTLSRSSDSDADETLQITMHRKTYRIPFRDIIYLESRRNTVHIFTSYSDFQCLSTLTGIKEQLPAEFIRVHRSFIVNQNYIHSFNLQEISMTLPEVQIPVGNKYASQLKRIREE